MFCTWFVTLLKSSFPRNPLPLGNYCPWTPLPLGISNGLPWGGGGMDILWNHTHYDCRCNSWEFVYLQTWESKTCCSSIALIRAWCSWRFCCFLSKTSPAAKSEGTISRSWKYSASFLMPKKWWLIKANFEQYMNIIISSLNRYKTTGLLYIQELLKSSITYSWEENWTRMLIVYKCIFCSKELVNYQLSLRV